MTSKTIFRALIATAAVAVPMALAAMPPSEAWEIGPMVRGENYSIGMPAHPRPGPKGSLIVDFPVEGAGQVDALTTSLGPLAGARQVTLRYRVDAAPGTRFIPDEAHNETATVSLYFQRTGDNWSARGRFASYRWYAPSQAVVPLAPGVHKITVQFSDNWTNVYGKPKDAVGAEFADAMKNTDRIGLAFGSLSMRSHGVYATGPARFTLLGMDIE